MAGEDNEKSLKKDNLRMADRRKTIQSLYTGDDNIRLITGRSPFPLTSTLLSETNLTRIFSQISAGNAQRKDIVDLSNYAYATEPTYSEIIDYLSNMYMWRYYYIPVAKRKTAGKAEYKEIYDLMSEIVDGLNIEMTFPMILSKLLIEGVVYLYTEKNTSSKTVNTIILNSRYCSPVMKSQYGTGIFQFDLRYFDDFGVTGEALEEILKVFPKELTEAYRDYKGSGGEAPVPGSQKYYKILDGRYSTYINVNDYNFPKKLSVLKSILDYNQYQLNEVEKNTSELDHVLTHEIPTHEDRLLFELPEVKELHTSMSRMLAGTKRIKLLTTFGKTSILPLQAASGIQNNTLERANKAIFDKAGLNSGFFVGSTPEALRISITKDSSTIWNYIQKIINFYNLTINNLYNFKGYQIELTMLPITHYNQNEDLELYRRNAEFGIGKIEAIIASGIKQKHIQSKYTLEEFLDLDEILKPLSSAHTQSGNTSQTPAEKTEIDKTEEENEIDETKTDDEE